MSKIYKKHNCKITFASCNQLPLYNYQVKEEYPMDGKWQIMDANYDFRVTSADPQKNIFWVCRRKMGKKALLPQKVIQTPTIFTWDDTFKLCVTSEGNFRCNSESEMVSREVHRNLLEHHKNVSFVCVWKIGYYYLPKTMQTFK